jgi:hypothetical protein
LRAPTGELCGVWASAGGGRQVTPWKESGLLLWLWALVTTHTVLFLIGPRSAEMMMFMADQEPA